MSIICQYQTAQNNT